MNDVLALILSGGRGRRLLPLTRERAKGVVPFGGRFRLIDIPISNCLHAALGRIFVLTEFLSSTVHQYVHQAYRFDTFGEQFVRVLTAEQTVRHTEWCQGTADAVRWSLGHLREHRAGHYLILASDQVYRMDLAALYRRHLQTRADVTVACVPVCRFKASALGVVRVDGNGRITKFLEKPDPDEDLKEWSVPASLPGASLQRSAGRPFLASMGTYVFRSSCLAEALSGEGNDFGRDVLPASCGRFRMVAYVFPGFWEDVGTVRSFFDTSLRLASPRPPIDLFDPQRPFYCVETHLPPTRIIDSRVDRLLAAEGCRLRSAEVRGAVLGERSVVEGAYLREVVCLGNSGYANGNAEGPAPGIGPEARLRGVIVDEDATVGRGCRIGVDRRKRPDGDFEGYSVRDGIIVIHRKAVIPEGTVL
jgi:glucose-1-phosphate adenylyltransferase